MTRCTLLASAALLIALPARAIFAQYVVTNLGDFSGGQDQSFGSDINSVGQVVGYGHAASGRRAFLWNPTIPNLPTGSLVDIGELPGGSGSVSASGVNATGQVTGTSAQRAFLWTPNSPNSTSGSMVNLGNLPGDQSGASAYAINAYGQVAGSSDVPFALHPFLWTPTVAGATNGSMIDLGLLPGAPANGRGESLGINDNGQVVGYAGSSSGNHAFLWSPGLNNGTTGSMVALGELPGTNRSIAYAINGIGQVIGYCNNAQALEVLRAYLWQPISPNSTTGTMFDLGNIPGGTDLPLPFAINSHGTIVGEFLPPDYGLGIGTFVWIPDTPNGTTGTMHDLNDMIEPSGAVGWNLTGARGINDFGQISGWGLFDTDGPGGVAPVTRAFLLTPIPEPSALFLFGVAAVITCAGLRLRARMKI